jgi:hypothetical protein
MVRTKVIGGCGASSGLLPGRSLEIVTMISSLTVPTHWSETHPLHPLDPPIGRKTTGKKTASASYHGQWRGIVVVCTEVNSCRRARVQDNTASWISRSPAFVSSRMLRRVCAISSDVTGFVGLPASSWRPSNIARSSDSASRARWGRSGSSRFCSFPNSPSTNPSTSSRRMRAIWARPSLVCGISSPACKTHREPLLASLAANARD